MEEKKKDEKGSLASVLEVVEGCSVSVDYCSFTNFRCSFIFGGQGFYQN